MNTVTFALAKGRLAELTMERLDAIGMNCAEMGEKSRKLVFDNTEQNLRFFLAKASDVPTYVEYGAADVGVVGKDTILEAGRKIDEILDLEFGKCRIVVAGKENGLPKNGRVLRVATKYPAIAREYFNEKQKQTVEIIRLNGSVELGPIVCLADVIVDIVETGATLEQNGLVVLDEICKVSARLAVNPVSMKLKHKRITEIVTKLRENL